MKEEQDEGRAKASERKDSYNILKINILYESFYLFSSPSALNILKGITLFLLIKTKGQMPLFKFCHFASGPCRLDKFNC